MINLTQNDSGLYVFSVKITGPKKNKVLQGLIDTGSTDCACTHPVLTTLYARPTSLSKVRSIETTKICLIYTVFLGFDGKTEPIELIRVSKLPDNIHLILGMSFLSKCNLTIKGKVGKIEWKSSR